LKEEKSQKIKYISEYETSWTDPGTFFRMEVGNWRYTRPIVDKSKCNSCAMCYFYCPTNCIKDRGDHFSADLAYCKGCGICARECPLNAIVMVDEVQFAGQER
jgi:2-oxoacid:acceptor oxidoreductase delta subunit (pyruvate/2-ketoisovalerate family)